MKKFIKLLALFSSLSLLGSPLQEAINHAKPFSTLHLSSGTYHGTIAIDKPLTLDGENNHVLIDGDKNGTVITITSPHVTLKNLTIQGSGQRSENSDSAIKAEHASQLKVLNCTIKDVLYGIVLAYSNNCILKENTISSNGEKIPLRGDGVKLWYAHKNLITKNHFEKIRDVHLLRSHENNITHNTFKNCRFATHIEHSLNTTISNNIYKHNTTAILLTMAKKTTIVSNDILSSDGVAGIGIVAMGGKDINITNNKLMYNYKALYIDNKPKERNIQRVIENNNISHNIEALHFHAIISNNRIKNNIIAHNLEDVIKDVYSFKNKNNDISKNYWSAYQGFDKNDDGIGDSEFVIYKYADKLWQHTPSVKFFYGSPVVGLIDFMCQVAPFTKPIKLIEDKKPLISPPVLKSF